MSLNAWYDYALQRRQSRERMERVGFAIVDAYRTSHETERAVRELVSIIHEQASTINLLGDRLADLERDVRGAVDLAARVDRLERKFYELRQGRAPEGQA